MDQVREESHAQGSPLDVDGRSGRGQLHYCAARRSSQSWHGAAVAFLDGTAVGGQRSDLCHPVVRDRPVAATDPDRLVGITGSLAQSHNVSDVSHSTGERISSLRCTTTTGLQCHRVCRGAPHDLDRSLYVPSLHCALSLVSKIVRRKTGRTQSAFPGTDHARILCHSSHYTRPDRSLLSQHRQYGLWIAALLPGTGRPDRLPWPGGGRCVPSRRDGV